MNPDAVILLHPFALYCASRTSRASLRAAAQEGLSVFSVMDKTVSPGGRRLLRTWFQRPICAPAAIARRHAAVAFFLVRPLPLPPTAIHPPPAAGAPAVRHPQWTVRPRDAAAQRYVQVLRSSSNPPARRRRCWPSPLPPPPLLPAARRLLRRNCCCSAQGCI